MELQIPLIYNIQFLEFFCVLFMSIFGKIIPLFPSIVFAFLETTNEVYSIFYSFYFLNLITKNLRHQDLPAQNAKRRDWLCTFILQTIGYIVNYKLISFLDKKIARLYLLYSKIFFLSLMIIIYDSSR